ncbi:hypothetical protein R6Q57_003420 [Mikania cordata]
MAQQLQILWKDNHNLALLISPPPESQKQFAYAIHGFNTCKISHALRMNPVSHENIVEEFLLSANINKEGDGGKGTITTRVQDTEIVISEAVIREVMAFTNKPTDHVSLEKEVIEGVLSEMGYEGVYSMMQKKLLIPYWRYIAHVFMVCMSGNKGTFDMLNKKKSFAFVALAMNWEYNFSKFILNEMKGNLKGSKYERFMMYPRFLQMIFDERYSGLQRGVVTRDLNLLSESTFPLIMQNQGGKYKFEEDVVAAEAPNVFVEEEHDVEILPEYEDVTTGDEPDLDFDFEMETIPVESDLPEQVNLLTTENLEALLKHVKRSVGNPPPASSFVDQEPPLDVTADLVPRKRRRRDPRPGPTEPFPQIKESTAVSSSHTEDIDYDSFLAGETGTRADKGKNALPDDEPIHVVKFQSRVFELEQDSLSHTLLIQELKTDNEIIDKKFMDLETNMGHLSAIVLDLKQKLQEKFKGEFIDESSSSTVAEPAPEMSRADFDELTRSHEEGLRKYFSVDTGFKVSIEKYRETMMITNRTTQEAKDAAKFKIYKTLVGLETIQHHGYDRVMIEQVGRANEFDAMVTSRWGLLLRCEWSQDDELIVEFLSTLCYDTRSLTYPRAMLFTLGRTTRGMSVSQFAVSMGIHTQEEVAAAEFEGLLRATRPRYVTEAEMATYWGTIFVPPHTDQRLSTQIHDPLLCCIH